MKVGFIAGLMCSISVWVTFKCEVDYTELYAGMEKQLRLSMFVHWKQPTVI